MQTIMMSHAVSDELLTARVRAAISRAISNPGAVRIFVASGVVTLGGPVLASERDEATRCARGVQGVTAVEDRLEPYERGPVPGIPHVIDEPPHDRYTTNLMPLAKGAAIAAAGLALLGLGSALRSGRSRSS